MTEVELPDGTIAEFPDGMQPQEIERVLQQQFGHSSLPETAPIPPSRPTEQQSAAAEEFRRFASGATQNPARAQYDALPGWQKPIVAAKDILDLTANGATMGWGDKAVAAVRAPFTGKTYDAELAAQRRLTEGARRRSGGAGTVAEVAGGLRTALSAGNAGLTLAGPRTAALTGATGLGARTGLMAAEGAGYGALTAAGNDTNIAQGALYGAAAGGLGNVAGEAISAGVGKVAGAFNKRPPKITSEELKQTGKAAYKAAEDAGVVFNQSGVTSLRTNVIQDLTERGFDPINEPGVVPVLQRLEAMDGNVTLTGLETLRKVASNGYRPGMKSNNAAIGGIINRIDELVTKSGPDAYLMGDDPKAAANALMKARSYWHRARKLDTVEGLINKGELIGGTQKSQDIAGATRRQLRTILTNESKARGFTQQELDATKRTVLGSPTKRALDAASGMVPTGRLSGLAQGSLGAANLATGNFAGLALQGAGMVAGMGAQKLGEALSKRSVEELADLIARGGVPAPVVQNTLQRLAQSKRDALVRLLMTMGIQQTVTP